MSENSLTYSVQDRSILLPFYKRILVEPFLGYIPRSIHPNDITHGGHLINLLALALLVAFAPTVDRGWLFLVVPVLVHIWLWCDHADGGHARRVGKCSAKGELLDHGLDLLNATYVVSMSVAALGAPAPYAAAAVVAVTGAAAIIYWEQAETGVFQLGLLTQIESVFSLTGLLIIRGFFGAQALQRPAVFGVSFPVGLLMLVTAVACFGMLRSAARVAKHGGNLRPFFAQVAFGLAFVGALLSGTLGIVPAILTGSSVFVFLGLRALEQRLSGQSPVTERAVYFASVILAACALLKTFALGGGATSNATLEWGTAALLGGVFAVRAALSAKASLGLVDKIDAARQETGPAT